MTNDRREILGIFDNLLIRFYRVVGKYAAQTLEEEKIKGLINVAWTAVAACATQIKKAEKEGKSLTEIKLIVFRFEQQLDALNPLHPFVPSKHI